MSEVNYLYTKDHEWVKIDQDNAIIGITDFAQGELGDIIFIELPKVGDKFNKGDIFGTIEAVKTVADLFMPISGTIAELNEAIENSPEIVNNDALNHGWIIKIKIDDIEESYSLLSATEYKKIIND